MLGIKRNTIIASLIVMGSFNGLVSCNSDVKEEKAITVDYPEQELGWKLGAQAYTFNQFNFSEALDKIDSCNLKFVEAYPGQAIGSGIEGTMNYDMDSTTRVKVLELLQSKGIKLVAYGVVNPDSEAEWVKLFQFGKAMGIETFTSEPKAEFLPLISKLCDEYEINLAIHNHPVPRNYWNPDLVVAAYKDQSPRVGACADVGHWVRSGLDVIESLKKLDGRILHLHMKDLNDKDGEEDRDVHWGTGVANTLGIIEELKNQQFKGMLSAEYESNWDNNVPDVKASVEFFRGALK